MTRQELYDELMEELGGDEILAARILLDYMGEDVLRQIIADVKERNAPDDSDLSPSGPVG